MSHKLFSPDNHNVTTETTTTQIFQKQPEPINHPNLTTTQTRYKKATLLTSAILLAACVTFTACAGKNSSGHDTGENTANTTNTLGIAETTMEASTGTLSQNESIKAVLEEESKKVAEMMASMQAAVVQASKEAASNEAEAKSEAESKVAEAQEAAKAQEAVMLENAAKLAGSMLTAESDVVTIGGESGVESADYQYTANIAIYEELIRLVNELRTSAGADKLVMDENMCLDACKKAVDSGYEAASAAAVSSAEDEAYKTASQIFEHWKGSDADYNNMVNADFKGIGVGSYRTTWVMYLR